MPWKEKDFHGISCWGEMLYKSFLSKSIDGEEHLKKTYHLWKNEEQEEFLDMCTGARGVKMFYDAFFKEVMDPEYAPQRLSDFLSAV